MKKKQGKSKSFRDGGGTDGKQFERAKIFKPNTGVRRNQMSRSRGGNEVPESRHGGPGREGGKMRVVWEVGDEE